MEKLNQLKTELSREWNKKKLSNLPEGCDDHALIRDYKKIKSLQKEINDLKGKK